MDIRKQAVFQFVAWGLPVSILCLCSVLPCAAGAQYTVEVLHSPAVPAPRSYGWGTGGGQQVGHTNIFLGGPSHALLWSGSANSFVDLHPAGFSASYAMAADGGRQAGWREDASGMSHATMWSGTAASWSDLHNGAYSGTRAYGIGGGQQVGEGLPFGGLSRALLWEGTPESLVDLHPQGDFDLSLANDADGVQQVGFVRDPSLNTHAALWSGTAASFVNLHPDGSSVSEALGVADGQQVGWAGFAGSAQAALWTDTAASFVSLNPGPTWGSAALATNGANQVGHAGSEKGTAFQLHAARWSGTASSYFDLHTLLPSQFIGSGAQSRAMGIDEFGNIVGWAADLKDGGRAKAVLWRPVPEPSSALGMGVLLVLFVIRGRLPWQRKPQ